MGELVLLGVGVELLTAVVGVLDAVISPVGVGVLDNLGVAVKAGLTVRVEVTAVKLKVRLLQADGFSDESCPELRQSELPTTSHDTCPEGILTVPKVAFCPLANAGTAKVLIKLPLM